MKQMVLGICCAVACAAVIVSAQDKGTSMGKMSDMSKEKTYSGCLELSQPGAYSLTHLMAADTKASTGKADPMMKGDQTMKADPMMKADSMKPSEKMGKDSMSMAPASLSLSAPGKDLSKYVGQTVTVTGSDANEMNGTMTFRVKSLKTVRKSCG